MMKSLIHTNGLFKYLKSIGESFIKDWNGPVLQIEGSYARIDHKHQSAVSKAKEEC